MKIAILGGTGNEGKGLGFRWAAAGHEIVIGSRVQERADTAAADLNGLLRPEAPRSGALPAGTHPVTGAENLAAAQQGEIVVLSVPYKAQEPTLEAVKPALAGKLLITVVAPLQPPKVSHVWHPPAGSAAEEAQAQVGEDTRVVAAFQNVSAELLMDLHEEVDCDVLICGRYKEDKQQVQQLCTDANMRGIDAGPLQNASVAEGLTAVLIGINIRHKIKHSGIRITGLPA